MSHPEAAPVVPLLVVPLVRPLAAGDEATVLAVFDGLTPEQRLHRFHVPAPRLTEGMRRWLADVDGQDRVALVAWLADRPVGIARYYRVGPQQAEAAVAVVGQHTRRGIGGALVDALAEHAVGGGITELVFDITGTNTAALQLVRSRGAVLGRVSATVHGVVPLRRPLSPGPLLAPPPAHSSSAA